MAFVYLHNHADHSLFDGAAHIEVVVQSDAVLPRFLLPDGETAESHFRKKCEEGLEFRYGPDWRNVEVAGIKVAERYEYEAETIVLQGFPSYFIVVQELVQWTKAQGIGVGPGRGSVAGAIVAYAMGITELCPLANGLIFERFLTVERTEMPDIDIDFDDQHRMEVINHVRDVYGENRIADTITFGKPQAKIAVHGTAAKGHAIAQHDELSSCRSDLFSVDFFGLRHLGVISDTCVSIERRHGIHIDPADIPLNDPAAFDLMCSGNMDGLFQVEGAPYVDLFHKMQPSTFAHMSASIALNRPGPLQNGFVDDYVGRMKGKQQITYYDDKLRPVLEETYGMIVYQEQLMQISMTMCGFSAGKADKLRRAMGKKIKGWMAELEDDWNNGAVKNGYPIEVAKQIWLDAEKFAVYAFNKSHSVAYAAIVMRTAYLKAHYPKEYMVALLTKCEYSHLQKYIKSCEELGIKVSVEGSPGSQTVSCVPTESGIQCNFVCATQCDTAPITTAEWLDCGKKE